MEPVTPAPFCWIGDLQPALINPLRKQVPGLAHGQTKQVGDIR